MFTAIGAVVIEKKPPNRQEFLSLLVLVGGVSIAVYEGSGTKSSFTGVVLCLIGELLVQGGQGTAGGWLDGFGRGGCRTAADNSILAHVPPTSKPGPRPQQPENTRWQPRARHNTSK